MKKRVSSRKTQLEADLKAGKTISAEEEEWLDHGAGNFVDEERVVEVFDNGSDYERGLERLDTKDREPPPARHEALQAKIIIKKYIETIDEPYARKLENILADFAHSTRLVEAQNMKPSLLTDYFAHK